MARFTSFAIAHGFDVNDAESISIDISSDGHKLWMNIEGVLAVRGFAIKEIIINDYRNRLPDTD